MDVPNHMVECRGEETEINAAVSSEVGAWFGFKFCWHNPRERCGQKVLLFSDKDYQCMCVRWEKCFNPGLELMFGSNFSFFRSRLDAASKNYIIHSCLVRNYKMKKKTRNYTPQRKNHLVYKKLLHKKKPAIEGKKYSPKKKYQKLTEIEKREICLHLFLFLYNSTLPRGLQTAIAKKIQCSYIDYFKIMEKIVYICQQKKSAILFSLNNQVNKSVKWNFIYKMKMKWNNLCFVYKK